MSEKFGAKVRVMRSHDYCQFEAELTALEPVDLEGANDLRKHAAVLVDEAVRQYDIAKKKERERQGKEWDRSGAMKRLEHAKSLPAHERTIEQAALVRAEADQSFWAEIDRDSYYYQDDEREYHFSMLNKFKDFRVAVSGES